MAEAEEEAGSNRGVGTGSMMKRTWMGKADHEAALPEKYTIDALKISAQMFGREMQTEVPAESVKRIE